MTDTNQSEPSRKAQDALRLSIITQKSQYEDIMQVSSEYFWWNEANGVKKDCRRISSVKITSSVKARKWVSKVYSSFLGDYSVQWIILSQNIWFLKCGPPTEITSSKQRGTRDFAIMLDNQLGYTVEWRD